MSSFCRNVWFRLEDWNNPSRAGCTTRRLTNVTVTVTIISCLHRSHLLCPLLIINMSQPNYPVGSGEMGQNEKLVHCDGNCWEGRRGRRAYENRVREEKRLRLKTPSELHLSQHPSTQAGRLSPYPRNKTSEMDADEAKSPSNTIVLEFKEDTALTEVRFLLLNFRCRTEESVGTICVDANSRIKCNWIRAVIVFNVSFI